MNKSAVYLILLLSRSIVTSCASPVQHADPFYNVGDDFSIPRFPLIKPTEAEYLASFTHWRIFIEYGIFVHVPTRPGNFFYVYDIEELEKFAVENGVIMAYSAYVDVEADAYIQDNFFHWFVLIPDQEIAEGFHTEDEFRDYVQNGAVKREGIELHFNKFRSVRAKHIEYRILGKEVFGDKIRYGKYWDELFPD